MDWSSCIKYGGTTGADIGVPTIQCLEPIFFNVVRAVMGLTGIALFILLLVSGFSYMTAGGDQKKLEQAKATLTNAIIGLVVMLSALIILRLIGAFTGIGDTITIFRIIAP